ncbi:MULTISPECIES: helix-turn-helix domain-containing protein [Hungatella]|jgi:excisionase family DNA binding protein|uniref:helix-turn-helix domain-containing protein n=1 Tax=Hungatella TaxID=1649459 RepID=UPI0011DD8971|nr:helix-turn-helix domain-containing protein [Hungatella hathewayi]DAS13083.1 MAG TPA: helix-turn-helix domain protein [Bacteriophage sp.]
MVEPYKPLYTVKETSEILKVNKGIVYNLIKSGELPHLVLGSIKVRGTDLERFIQSYPVEGGDEHA